MAAGLNFTSSTGMPFGFRSVAAAGTNQATATALASYSSMIHNVTGADGTKGVRLVSPTAGKHVMIRNASGSAVLPVYPQTGGTINGGATNAAFSVAPNSMAVFWALSSTTWAAGGLDNSGDSSSSAGTLASVTGLTATESESNGLHHTVFSLAAMPLTLADATVGGGVKIYTFPLGATLILAAAGKVFETTTSTLASTLNAGVTYNWGVGTTTQANGTLATTEQDIIPTTNGTASATINVEAAASSGARTAAPAAFNGTSTAKEAYFNVGIATATDIDGDATTTWRGTVSIFWIVDPASV